MKYKAGSRHAFAKALIDLVQKSIRDGLVYEIGTINLALGIDQGLQISFTVIICCSHYLIHCRFIKLADKTDIRSKAKTMRIVGRDLRKALSIDA